MVISWRHCMCIYIYICVYIYNIYICTCVCGGYKNNYTSTSSCSNIRNSSGFHEIHEQKTTQGVLHVDVPLPILIQQAPGAADAFLSWLSSWQQGRNGVDESFRGGVGHQVSPSLDWLGKSAGNWLGTIIFFSSDRGFLKYLFYGPNIQFCVTSKSHPVSREKKQPGRKKGPWLSNLKVATVSSWDSSIKSSWHLEASLPWHPKNQSPVGAIPKIPAAQAAPEYLGSVSHMFPIGMIKIFLTWPKSAPIFTPEKSILWPFRRQVRRATINGSCSNLQGIAGHSRIATKGGPMAIHGPMVRCHFP